MIQVVASATDGRQAVSLASTCEPDVIVMDIGMPGLNGIKATRLIHDRSPRVGILMLTMFEDDESVFAAMRAGARGYLLKGADGEEIVHAVHAIARGEAIFGPALAQRISNFFSAAPAPTQSPIPDNLSGLTAREKEVLDLVAAGHNNMAMASKLFLSHKTVRNHVSSIFAKLQVADRPEAIVQARRHGLGLRDGDSA